MTYVCGRDGELDLFRKNAGGFLQRGRIVTSTVKG